MVWVICDYKEAWKRFDEGHKIKSVCRELVPSTRMYEINVDKETTIDKARIKGKWYYESFLLEETKTLETKQFNEPSHYHKGDIDVIKFMGLFFKDANLTASEGFFIGNILKYTCRFKEKNGMDDLKKAKDYIERLIDYEKSKI